MAVACDALVRYCSLSLLPEQRGERKEREREKKIAGALFFTERARVPRYRR